MAKKVRPKPSAAKPSATAPARGIADLTRRLGAVRGWRRCAIALLAGAFTIAAFPPISCVPALLISFPVLIWLLDGCQTKRQAAITGWFFGFGHFTVSFYWIANAFYVDADTFGVWAVPVVGALCVSFAFYIALVCAVTHLIPPPRAHDAPAARLAVTAPRLLLFAAAWTFIEWMRSWLLSGFPWNPLATVWSETMTPIGLPMIQITAVIGVYGLSFFTILAATSPAILGAPARHHTNSRTAWFAAAAPLLVLVLIACGGWLRLATAATTFVPGVKLRLVQDGVAEADRQDSDLWVNQLKDLMALSMTDRPPETTAVIWAESAVPMYAFINVSADYRRVLTTAAPADGYLITGGNRLVAQPPGFNSLYVLKAGGGDIAAYYDKLHLVPFGEYIPLHWLIPFDKIIGGLGDYTAGSALVTITVPGLPPFTPLICYDTIFSGVVTPSDGPRPKWLLEVTNDAWFGASTGPYQHLAADRLRAVEEGLPVVRTADTGISAVIDGNGRTLSELKLGQRGALDVALPEPASTFTPFGRLGNLIPVSIALTAGSVAFLLRHWLKR